MTNTNLTKWLGNYLSDTQVSARLMVDEFSETHSMKKDFSLLQKLNMSRNLKTALKERAGEKMYMVWLIGDHQKTNSRWTDELQYSFMF